MFDKDSVESRLNADDSFREEFMNDPVGTLAKEGLKLDPDKEISLKEQLERIRGVDIPDGASIAANGISINIGISF